MFVLLFVYLHSLRVHSDYPRHLNTFRRPCVYNEGPTLERALVHSEISQLTIPTGLSQNQTYSQRTTSLPGSLFSASLGPWERGRSENRVCSELKTIGLLQQTITWYKIRHAGGQAHYYSCTETLKQRPVKLDWLRYLGLNVPVRK